MIVKRLPKLLLLLVSVGSLAYLFAGMPGLAGRAAWALPSVQPVWALSAAVSVAAFPVLVLGAWRLRARGHWLAAATVLTFSAAFAPFLFTLGASGGPDRLWADVGPGEVALLREAREHRSAALETLRDYERLAENGELGVEGPSRSPGALALRMAIDRLSEVRAWGGLTSSLAWHGQSLPRITGVEAALATSLWLGPLLGSLAIPGILFLGRHLLREGGGWSAAILYLGVPALFLRFPVGVEAFVGVVVTVWAAALVVFGTRRDHYWASVLAGALCALGLWLDLALVPALAIVLGCGLLVALERAEEVGRHAWYRAGWSLAFFVGGFLAVTFALQAALGFHLPAVFGRVAAAGSDTGALVRSAELLVFLGPPLVAAWLGRVAFGLASLRSRRLSTAELSGVGLAVFVASLVAVSGLAPEAVGWAFLAPFVCLVAGATVDDLASDEGSPAPLVWLATSQIALLLALQATLPLP